jgi:hypothetical protein
MAVDDLSVGLRTPATVDTLSASIPAADASSLHPPIDARRLEGVKFASCVPDELVIEMLVARDADPEGAAANLGEPITLASR